MRRFRDGSDATTSRVSPADIINSGLCIGCGSCAGDDAKVRMGWDSRGFLKPSGPRSWRDNRSEGFSQRCPFSPLAANEDEIASDLFIAAPHQDRRIGRFEKAYVGYAAEGPFRPNGSSGG